MPYLSMNYPMVIFIDERYFPAMQELCEHHDRIKLIAINHTFMQDNIYAYRQLDKQREIMKSESFQKLISHRIGHPECCKPEYNMLQHAKIDFVAFVINNQICPSEYYAWTDFGFFQRSDRIPTRPLELSKFNLSKINFQGINPITANDQDIIYTLTKAPERIGGFFYLGSPQKLLEYQKLYHEICEEFYSLNIDDDDQHIMIQSVFRRPDLFEVWTIGWHMTYLHFQQ
jgi:hypothetical protein